MSIIPAIKFLFITACLLMLAFLFVPPLNTEKYFSPAETLNQTIPTTKQKQLHQAYMSADMHGDTLLWSRDISEPSDRGHADISRLLAGNVALQIFMAVVEAPDDVISDAIEDKGDKIRSIAFWDRWPLDTLTSYKARALYQAEKLRITAKKSANKLFVIESKQDLRDFLEQRKTNPESISSILGIEGAHPTEWNLENVEALFEAGFRSMELAHYTDTEYAGSSSGMTKYGITPRGKKLVRLMNELGMIIDVAHLSMQGVDEILEISSKPVYFSHGGVYETCPRARNLTDEIIKKIVDKKGIIGIGFFEGAICDVSIQGIVMALRHVRDLVGAEHVGLGSGWDVSPLPIAPNQLALLSSALRVDGFSDTEVAMIMGGNVIRFFSENLPN